MSKRAVSRSTASVPFCAAFSAFSFSISSSASISMDCCSSTWNSCSDGIELDDDVALLDRVPVASRWRMRSCVPEGGAESASDLVARSSPVAWTLVSTCPRFDRRRRHTGAARGSSWASATREPATTPRRTNTPMVQNSIGVSWVDLSLVCAVVTGRPRRRPIAPHHPSSRAAVSGFSSATRSPACRPWPTAAWVWPRRATVDRALLEAAATEHEDKRRAARLHERAASAPAARRASSRPARESTGHAGPQPRLRFFRSMSRRTCAAAARSCSPAWPAC